MKRLFVLEYLKLVPYRSFYVFLGLYVVLVLAVSFFAKEAVERFVVRREIGIDLFALPDLWRSLQFLAGYFNIFLGVLVVTLVGNEWEYLTLRQHIADGMSRLSAVLGKSLLVAVLSLFATLFIFLLGVVLGRWPDEVSHAMLRDTLHGMGRFGLQTFGYLSLAMLAGFCIRRTGMAIACFVFYILVLESIVGLLLDRWAPGTSSYLPVEVLAGMVESPLRLIRGGALVIPWTSVVLAGCYALAFNALSYVIVARSDL